MFVYYHVYLFVNSNTLNWYKKTPKVSKIKKSYPAESKEVPDPEQCLTDLSYFLRNKTKESIETLLNKIKEVIFKQLFTLLTKNLNANYFVLRMACFLFTIRTMPKLTENRTSCLSTTNLTFIRLK